MGSKWLWAWACSELGRRRRSLASVSTGTTLCRLEPGHLLGPSPRLSFVSVKGPGRAVRLPWSSQVTCPAWALPTLPSRPLHHWAPPRARSPGPVARRPKLPQRQDIPRATASVREVARGWGRCSREKTTESDVCPSVRQRWVPREQD